MGTKQKIIEALEGKRVERVWELIEKAITLKTKALMPVHYAGHPADMPAIISIAGKHNIPVIEDSCQAITAAIDNRTAGCINYSRTIPPSLYVTVTQHWMRVVFINHFTTASSISPQDAIYNNW